MNCWEIRPVRAVELDSVYAIFAACITPCWKKETFAARLEDSNALLLAALEGDRPVGFVDGECAFGVCELNNIAVLPQYRRRGVGNALLLALGQGARDKDCAVIQLEVRRSNQTALDFYRENGFVQVGRRKNYYTAPIEDALLLDKDLQEEDKEDETAGD